VFRGRNFLIYWLPVLVWMSLIFTASGDTHSGQHSSRIIEPILRWLFPHLAHARSATSFCSFANARTSGIRHAGATALARVAPTHTPRPAPVALVPGGFALLVTALYAGSDEIHQLFVPSREGRFEDVLIDATGAALGLFVLWLFGKWRKFW